MTHPFHPWCGREFELVSYHPNWGEERVNYHDERGQLVSLPARWTSLFSPDPFVVVSAGRACFCVADLLELARLIQVLDAPEVEP